MKVTTPLTTSYLVHIMTNSFQKGCFQNDPRKTKFVPPHKSGTRLDKNNNQPISIEMFNLCQRKQFGSRKKQSCAGCLR